MLPVAGLEHQRHASLAPRTDTIASIGTPSGLANSGEATRSWWRAW